MTGGPRTPDVDRDPTTDADQYVGDDMDTPSNGSQRRRWWWLAGVSALVIVAVGGWIVGQRVQSSDQAASRAAPPEPSWITATVEQRILSQTVISRGDVRPQVSVDVAAPSSVEGEAIVTNIGVTVGDEAVEGTRLVEISGRPVFVMAGEVPVYRTLKPGMSGTDVSQLQQALTRLGYTPDIDGVFGEATKTAVTAFYDATGYTPMPTSDTVNADLAAAEQAVTEAQSALDDAEDALSVLIGTGISPELIAAQAELDAAKRDVTDTTASSNAAINIAQLQVNVAVNTNNRVLGDSEATQNDVDQAAVGLVQANSAVDQARRDASSQIAAAKDRVVVAEANVAAAQATSDVTTATRTRDNAVVARDSATGTLSTLIATTGPTVAQGEIVFAPTLPARVQTAATTLGPTAGAPANGEPGTTATTALVTLAGGSLVVSMTARTSEKDLVRIAMPVEVLDEQINISYPATISEIATTAITGADGQLGYPMVLTPDSPLPAELAGANVRVTITAASTDTESLVVPVAAVSSAGDGSARVSVLRAAATDPVDVPVTAGLSADGFIAVEPVNPNGLNVGDRVVVGR